MRRTPQKGVALIMAVLIVALVTILISNLAYSTYLGQRKTKGEEQRLKAEYLLKSLLSLSRVLIATGPQDVDPPKESWGMFVSGTTVLPASLLGIQEPNTSLGLEITAEDGKISLDWLKVEGKDPTKLDSRIKVFLKLFELLGFNDDKEVDQTGLFPDEFISPEQMVANLIDYMDVDPASFSNSSALSVNGCEDRVPPDTFPEKGTTIARLEELYSIPGFTPERVRKLAPYITTVPVGLGVNVNLAPFLVLQSLDPQMTEAYAQQLFDLVRGPEGPITSATFSLVDQYLPSPYVKDNNLLTYRSKRLQVVAKAQFGETKYFLKANLEKSSGSKELPKVLSLELFG